MVTIKEVDETDLNRLAEYLPRQLPFYHTTKETWKLRFALWWDSNPAFTSQIPRGWVLENENSLVGFIGNVPVKFLLCGEEKTAVTAVTWYVDPSVRGFTSIRLFNEVLKQRNVSLFLFNTEIKNLMTILYKNKFREYDLPLFQTEYLALVNKKNLGFILKEFRILKKPTWGVLKRIVCLMRAYGYPNPLARPGAPAEKEYTTSLCTSCDDAFVRMWNSRLTNCDVTLSRDTKTLNWIYFPPAGLIERVVIQCKKTKDNSLAGYMVFDSVRSKPAGTGVMKLMDMCIEKNDPGVMALLLQYAYTLGKQNNIALLELWSDNEETEGYLKSTFTLRRAAHHHNYFRFSNEVAQPESLSICPSMIAPPRGIDHF